MYLLNRIISLLSLFEELKIPNPVFYGYDFTVSQDCESITFYTDLNYM